MWGSRNDGSGGGPRPAKFWRTPVAATARALASLDDKTVRWAFYGCVANFLLFCAISLYLGGTAGNGRVSFGHYMLGDHGVFVEVSYTTYTYSRVHLATVCITHPLAIVFGAEGNRRKRLHDSSLRNRNIFG